MPFRDRFRLGDDEKLHPLDALVVILLLSAVFVLIGWMIVYWVAG
jgi:hypothetical protein